MRKSLSYLAPFWVLFAAGVVFPIKAFGKDCSTLRREISRELTNPANGEKLPNVPGAKLTEGPGGIILVETLNDDGEPVSCYPLSTTLAHSAAPAGEEEVRSPSSSEETVEAAAASYQN